MILRVKTKYKVSMEGQVGDNLFGVKIVYDTREKVQN